MRDLQETGRPVDMITLAEELDRRKEVEAIGGVAYLSSLIDGVPDRPCIEHYVRIVRNKALLRGLINIAQNAIAEAIEHSDEAEEVINRAEQAIFQLSENRLGQGFSDIPSIIKGSFGSLDELYARGQEITGLATHYTQLDKMTSGLPAVRPDHHRRAPLDGQDRAGHEHRRERRHARRQSGRRLLAGNVEGSAAHAHAGLARAGGLAQACAPASSPRKTCAS